MSMLFKSPIILETYGWGLSTKDTNVPLQPSLNGKHDKIIWKKSFLIVENLEAQEAPESNNAVMLFKSSVSPATLKRFLK